MMALTGGGPGTSASDVPAIFMYRFVQPRPARRRAASAVMMLMTIIAVMVPLMYAETRSAQASR